MELILLGDLLIFIGGFMFGSLWQKIRRTKDALDGVPPQEAGDLTPADVHAKMARLAKPRRQ